MIWPEDFINKIINNDCLKVMPLIPDKSIDMILCDLPYGVTARNKWDNIIPFEDLWINYKRIIKDNGAIVLTATQPFATMLIASNTDMFRYDLIWEKSHAVGFLNARKMPMRKHENILVFYRKLPIYNPQILDKPKENIRPIPIKNRKTLNYGIFDEGNHRTIPIDKTYPASIIKVSNESKVTTLHPTQKPVALFEYLIKTYTNENDIVLDNTCGSGTTCLAAKNLNRKFIGIEMEEKYYKIACERVEGKI